MVSYHDLYIIRWLLQGTERGDIIWQQDHECGPFFFDFNKDENHVRVEINIVLTRPPTGPTVRFKSPGLGEVQVVGPMRAFSLRKKYDTPEEGELAEAVKRLFAKVSRQHAERELHDREIEEERKQAIFHRLMGGSD